MSKNNPTQRSAVSPGDEQELSLLSSNDLHLFHEGTHCRVYEKLGAHLTTREGKSGVHFAVWAPHAESVSVMGEFNNWDAAQDRLLPTERSGIWQRFIPGVGQKSSYKYRVLSRENHHRADKSDPFGFRHQLEPETASVVWDLQYHWEDADWMAQRGQHCGLNRPISIYEVHLGSWMRVPEESNRWLTYEELAPRLAGYAERMGFSHVELLPVMRHPQDASLGYFSTGYFAPTGRFGSPQSLMYLIDHLHQSGLGVILDWVPSHFPKDDHGLAFFDGTPLFETGHNVPKGSSHGQRCSFDYHRPEVRSFLLSSAMFWLDKYHVDGLRIGNLAAMLYLDHGRAEGEWTPNRFGGRENLEAIAFLRQFNEAVYREYPDVQTFAEESTAWPMVSRPTYVGGLGFGFKWDIGFTHDTLGYLSNDPLYRKYHHNELTFRGMYAFAENFILPLPHEEVMPGKGSLLSRMPGDDWQKCANLRLLLAYQFCQPGKKLLFMGGEFGQWQEWNLDTSIDWHLLETPAHAGIQQWVRDLNFLYRNEPALHELDTSAAGFHWVDCSDADQSTLSWLRFGRQSDDLVLAVFNFTPLPRLNYRIGVPRKGFWKELLNSDAREYGGSGHGNFGGLETAPFTFHGHPQTLTISLPPLGAVIFKPVS